MENINKPESLTDKELENVISVDETVLATPDAIAEEIEVINEKLIDDIDNVIIESTETKSPATKAEVLEALKDLIEGEAKDISRDEVNRLKNIFNGIRRTELEAEKKAAIENGTPEEEFIGSIDEDEQIFLNLLNEIKVKKAAWIEQKEQEQKDNLEKKENIINEINNIAEDTDNVNRSYKLFKELSQNFRDLGDVPPEHSSAIWKRFQDAEQKFYDQLKVNQELRDYDFKKNLEIKKGIIEKAKELAAKVSDNVDDAVNSINDTVVESFRNLQDLHELWKITGPVAKELRDELWDNFKEATVTVNKAYQNFFEQRKAAEKIAEEAKLSLIEIVENVDFQHLKTAKQWENATKTIVEAQAKWKETGFVPRKINNDLFIRFRSACDLFFSNKSDFYSSLKKSQAENLVLKTELTERAEQLKDSTDWNKVAAELTKLQSQWKEIGPVPRKEGDRLWERFHTACDEFFNNRKTALSEQRKIEKENLEKKEEILKQLKELLEQEKDVREKLNILQDEWKAVGYVPIKEKNRITEEYRNTLSQIKKKFNIKEMKASFDKFVNQVQELAGDNNKLSRERERLFRFLENKRSDLNNYMNNMGFLKSKSRSGDGLLKEIEHKIELIQGDIQDLEKRISHLDSLLD